MTGKILTLRGQPMPDTQTGACPSILIRHLQRAVRSRFSMVERLDGHELPPPIQFDLEVNVQLPPAQPNFFADDQIKKILVPFLDKFFKVYDSGDRQPLLEVYHDQACFSLSVPSTVSKEPGAARTMLSRYVRERESRNLMVAKDPVSRNKLIKQKKVPIVAFFHDLPPTQHDMSSLKVDVSMARGSILCFTVSGTFIEVNTKVNNEVVIAFSRVFFAIHQPPNGLCIVNDELCLRPATYKQKAAFASPGPTPSTSPVNVPQGNPSPAPLAQAPQELTPPQQEMLGAFMRQSGMNAEFSLQCLKENNWAYEEAGKVFTKLQSEGKIPPEAFKQA